MPVVALAFHEQLAIEKLNEYFRSPEASARSESRAVDCKNCALTFAVVLVNRNDKRNAKYLDLLKRSIEADCIGGLHRDEYELNIALVS